MNRDDIAEKAEKGKQTLQDLQEDAKDKARETADTAKERPARTGGVIAAVVGGLAVVWKIVSRAKRRRASESSA